MVSRASRIRDAQDGQPAFSTTKRTSDTEIESREDLARTNGCPSVRECLLTTWVKPSFSARLSLAPKRASAYERERRRQQTLKSAASDGALLDCAATRSVLYDGAHLTEVTEERLTRVRVRGVDSMACSIRH